MAMKRRLIKQGGGGTTVYLPKKWTDERGLKSGDDIDIEETDQGLLFRSAAHPIKKEAIITADYKDDRSLRYLLVNHYRAGYDKVRITAKIDSKQLQPILQRLTGFELTESTENETVIEIISEPQEDKTDILMKQMFFILKDDLDYVITQLDKQKPLDYDRALMNTERIVRSANLLMRMMTKKLKPINGFQWTILMLIHWMDRRLYYLSKTTQGMKLKKLSKEHFEYFESVKRSLDHLYDGLFKRSVPAFMNIHDEYSEYEMKRHTLSAKQDEYTVIVMHCFNSLFRLLVYCTASGIGLVTMKEEKK